MKNLRVFCDDQILWVAEVKGDELGDTLCAVERDGGRGVEWENTDALALGLERLALRLRMAGARRVVSKR